ncbi:hypothetical protein SAMN05421788_107343 [Filimonas lacunae]|uniref:Uncharacterized protein n=1 Tax=Filimonas lacunae TaxID=477680 RepID=A0A173MGD5_9BACT|nr:hypothetical protein [Filimonas lacunae]BAV06684.1 hypothetical protein FLA_2703 [Filimonas lacunae]SIT27899.1 hypothetical protein SAMN05421788_107343 [Filimonas lacunae]
MNELPGQPTALPQPSQLLALNKLTKLIYEITNPSRSELLFDAGILVNHIGSLVTESIHHIHALCQELKPNMHESLTNRCVIVADLATMVKQSPQLKRYPETTEKAIIEGLENLCLVFHRQLYQLFPSDYQLPHSYLKMEVANANRQYQRLLSQYPENKLLKAVLRPVNKFVHHTAANNTKKCIEYNNTLLANIKLWQRKNGTQNDLYEIALAMNLNCPRFMHHMASEASYTLQSFEKNADKNAYIEQLQKLFLRASTSTQWRSSAYGAYLPDVHPVATQVQQWLSNQSDLVKLDAPESDGAQVSERIEMQVDAAFFCFLFRIMIIEGLTILKKFAPVFRIISQVISFSKTVEPTSANLIKLASGRVSNTMLDKLETFFNRCQLRVKKIRNNEGKFPDDAA